ncbi:MAG: rhodanese-like domain-containing protein [Erysipelotrichaceae bacterium]|nr:rhodanese-like domain-containing protein [Erysipelotrichaceae bacterium]
MNQNTNYRLVDVRTPQEYANGHIPGAINIPNETIQTIPPKQLPDRQEKIYTYCQSGMRSRQAEAKLRRMGYTDVQNIGGISSYEGEVKTGMQP